MPQMPKISDAEWEAMKVVWSSPAPVTANDVVDSLAAQMKWSPRTVKTLLNRLVSKGALTFEVQGKRYLYKAAVVKEECVRLESQSFLQRVFGGQAAPMLVHFVRNARLSTREIEELRKILKSRQET